MIPIKIFVKYKVPTILLCIIWSKIRNWQINNEQLFWQKYLDSLESLNCLVGTFN